MANNLELRRSVAPEYLPPWKHQAEATSAVRRSRSNGDRQGMCVLGVGMGKTRVGAEVIYEELSTSVRSNVLWLTHRLNLQRQSEQRIAKWFEMFDYDISTLAFNSQHHPQEVLNHDVVFGLFQTMENYRTQLPPDHFDLVIVDESHHSGARTYQSTLDYLKPKYILGLSGIETERELRDIYGPPLIRRDIVHGIKDRVLAPPDYRVISTSSVLGPGSETAEIEDFEALSSDEQQAFERLAIDFVRQELLKEGLVDSKVLIFNKSIKGADRVATLGDDIHAYHYKIKGRAQILEDFSTGKIRWLSSVRATNEGIDIPDINVIVILDGGESSIDFQQQVGRGLRKAPGKEKVIVFDFTNNPRRLALIRDFMRSILQTQGEHTGSGRQPSQDIDTLSYELDQVQLGRFTFDTQSRDALALLLEARAKTEAWHSWEAQDSLDYYRWLSQRLGHLATVPNIRDWADEDGMPSLSLLTRDFDNNLTSLRAAITGNDIDVQRREFINNWTPENSIRYYLELHAQLDGSRLPTKGDITRAANEIGMPSVWALVKDFDGELTLLRQACGFEVPSAEDLVSARTLANEKGVGDLAVHAAARALGFAAIKAMGPRGFMNVFTVEQAAQLRAAIKDLYPAQDGDVEVADFAASRSVSRATLNHILRTKKIIPERKRTITGRTGKFLSPVEQSVVDQHLSSYSIRPEGGYTINEAAEALEITPAALMARLRKLKITPKKYWKEQAGGFVTSHISDAEFDRLCQDGEPPDRFSSSAAL